MISEIHYRNMYGELLWKTEMDFSNLHAIGETVVWDSVVYIVRRVAIAGNFQHVNLEIIGG